MVAYLRGDMRAGNFMDDLEGSGASITTTPVNAYELFNGAWGSDNREENVRAVARFLNGVSMLEFDMEASLRAGRINSALMERGASIGVEDALVAGIVTRHRETLATRNTRHFGRVSGLRIVEW